MQDVLELAARVAKLETLAPNLQQHNEAGTIIDIRAHSIMNHAVAMQPCFVFSAVPLIVVLKAGASL